MRAMVKCMEHGGTPPSPRSLCPRKPVGRAARLLGDEPIPECTLPTRIIRPLAVDSWHSDAPVYLVPLALFRYKEEQFRNYTDQRQVCWHLVGPHLLPNWHPSNLSLISGEGTSTLSCPLPLRAPPTDLAATDWLSTSSSPTATLARECQ